MTSGTKYKAGGYPAKTDIYLRNWDGADGKYEVVNGKRRAKWNHYNSTLFTESVQLGSPTNETVSTSSMAVPTWLASDELELQSKLVKRIKGHEFNLAVNLAQSKQLSNMCVDNIRKFGRAARALKRGDVATAVRQFGAGTKVPKLKSKDISGRWLEMQYGWLPSLSDVYEAGKAYEAATDVRVNRISASIVREYPYDGSASPSIYVCPGTTRIKRKITYEMTEALSNPRTLGLMDPLSVVWEILPWSFVFDWFLPVGDYLENLAILPFLEGRFMTTTTSKTFCAYGSLIDPNPAYIPFFRGIRRVGKQISMQRSVHTGLSVQRPSFQPASLALSGKRIINAVALAHQLLK